MYDQPEPLTFMTILNDQPGIFNLDSTPRSRKIDKILAKFFQSFISRRIIAAAPIGFLFLKALYLSFQMHTS